MDFEAAVRRHQRGVYTFARYFLASREEAEDVTQEVLLRLWRHGESLDPEMLTGWLLRVTRNACLDLLRRRRSAGAGMVAIVAIGPDKSAARPSGEPDPEQAARGSELQRRVQEALRRLDEPYRSALILREVQGLPYQRISEVLGTPLNTVRVLIHRGRQKLRDQLREELGYATPSARVPARAPGAAAR